jgi:photosystem II stability/assembly factor-like uncharacterized protein
LNRLANVGLGLLALLAVVMVVVALRAASADPNEPRDTVGVETTPTPTPTPTQSTSVSEGPSEEPSETGSAEPLLPDAWISSLRHGLLVRAPVQECVPGAPPLSLGTSTDGGSTFAATEVTDLAVVTGINIVSPDEATVVGADFECEPAVFATVDGGESWKQRYVPPKFWTLVHGVDDQIRSPGGLVDVPCLPRAVSGIDGNVARLWCDDGQLMGTASAGESWIVLGRVPDGFAMVFPTLASGYVLGESDDCTGTTVLTTEDAGAHWDEVHCSTVDGPWALAADGRTVVVAGSNTADASPDAGRTWATR